MNSTTENRVEIIRTRNELQARVRAWKQAGETVGFVPTMGALHEGHLSLIEKAQEKVSRTVASIFVNPAQFAPGEDFDTYPRREAEDIAKLASVKCDAVYLPSVAEMYPEGSVTNVRVESLSDLLDGIYRPHIFYGVATVVGRLFLQQRHRVARGQRHEAQIGQGGLSLDRGHHRRRERRRHRVGHRHAELGAVHTRVEGTRRERALQVLQRQPHLRPQRHRTWRRLHAGGRAREQRLAHPVVDTLQRMAGGRLGERQHLGGTRDAAFGHDTVENTQQVQVQGSKAFHEWPRKISSVYTLHAKH